MRKHLSKELVSIVPQGLESLDRISQSLDCKVRNLWSKWFLKSSKTLYSGILEGAGPQPQKVSNSQDENSTYLQTEVHKETKESKTFSFDTHLSYGHDTPPD